MPTRCSVFCSQFYAYLHNPSPNADQGIDRDGRKTEEENLAIFGPRRGRRGAELKVRCTYGPFCANRTCEPRQLNKAGK